jgi:hypothetical protein
MVREQPKSGLADATFDQGQHAVHMYQNKTLRMAIDPLSKPRECGWQSSSMLAMRFVHGSSINVSSRSSSCRVEHGLEKVILKCYVDCSCGKDVCTGFAFHLLVDLNSN